MLYVGKARSIKKRIAAYMAPERQPTRIARMIAQTRSMVFVTTESEAEALLLEANLIKQMKPRYNVMLRDDKSFPYILICTGTSGGAARQASRRAQPRRAIISARSPARARCFARLNALQRAFLLRTCSDSFYDNRTRPCLLYQIKRCSAPCTGEIALDDYAEARRPRRAISSRAAAARSTSRLAAEMSEAAAALEFEKAARLRDRISALSAIQGEQSINPRSIAEADVFAVTEEAGQFCIEVFFFRTYQNWGNRAYFPRADRALACEEVLDAFLAAILSRPAGAAPRAVEPRGPERRDLVRGLERARRPSHRHRRAAARRKEGSRRRRDAQRARSAVAQARRSREPGEAPRRARRRLRRRSSDPPRRGLRQFPHHGDERDRRDGGRRAGGLRQEPVPHLQHQERRPHAGRRLRDDARSADAPLRAAHAAGRDGGGRRLSRYARPRHHRRRARAVRGGARGLARARRQGRDAGRDRQGPGPQRGTRDLLRRGPRVRSGSARAIRRFSSSSACATRRTASPSEPIAPGARRSSSRARSTKSPASARRASARCSTPSARPRTSPAPASPTSRRRRASTRRRRSWCTTFSTRLRAGDEAPLTLPSPRR